jgi:hypothetical protein
MPLRLHTLRHADLNVFCGRCGRKPVGVWYDADSYIAGNTIYAGSVVRCQECWDKETAEGNVFTTLPTARLSQAQAEASPPTATTPEAPHRPPD